MITERKNNSLARHLLAAAAKRSPGELVHPKEFLHLASRAAVDQTLSRLVKRGHLVRVGRGAYAAPIRGRFGTRGPSPQQVIRAMVEKTGETVTEHGAAAANQLGLTTQVPGQEVFLTSGNHRRLRFGARQVSLRHAPHWQLLLPNRPAGAAIRALAWLGPEYADEAVRTLHHRLPPEEWAALCKVRALLPSWLATTIGQAAMNA